MLGPTCAGGEERIASMSEVKSFARVTLVAAAASAAIGVAGAPTAGAVSQQTLIGAWSGPAIGDPGECGNGYAEYAFAPNGTYRYHAVYDTCDGVMFDGHYELQADGGVIQMGLELCSNPGCPPGQPNRTMSISAVDPNTIVLDGRYTYRRLEG
jgi:hypothetical protein